MKNINASIAALKIAAELIDDLPELGEVIAKIGVAAGILQHYQATRNSVPFDEDDLTPGNPA